MRSLSFSDEVRQCRSPVVIPSAPAGQDGPWPGNRQVRADVESMPSRALAANRRSAHPQETIGQGGLGQ